MTISIAIPVSEEEKSRWNSFFHENPFLKKREWVKTLIFRAIADAEAAERGELTERRA